MMTTREEMAITQRALDREPRSPEFRFRMARYHFTMDQFDEAVELLEELSSEGDDFRAVHLLGGTLLARETQKDTVRAREIATRAADIAPDAHNRARALAALGKAQIRLSEFDAARKTLGAALEANIHNRDAYKRLAMLDFTMDRIEAALEFADDLVSRGVAHPRVLGIRPLALAKLNRIEEARDAFGFDTYLHQAILPPPPGWDTIEAFNRDLAAELLTHPGIRYERYGVASAHSWRVDEPCLKRSKMVPLLQQLIKREAEAYIASLGDRDDAWLGQRKPSGFLHQWSVMTDGDGFEDWHVHQNGWLSGAYYVDIPDFIRDGDGPGGCVAFGLPEGIVGVEAQEKFGTQLFRPSSGLVMMFPAHSFHRTYAHRSDQRRICLAFDIASHDDVF